MEISNQFFNGRGYALDAEAKVKLFQILSEGTRPIAFWKWALCKKCV